MSSTIQALLSASVILFIGNIQISAATSDPACKSDSAYNLFVMQIQSQLQQAEYKLSFCVEAYINNTQTLNLPEFETINTTLYKCYEGLKANYPNADKDCMASIELEVQQTIADSEGEVAACTNLTHSWELIGPMLSQAEGAMESLNETVARILDKACTCVTRYPKNQNLKLKCFNSVVSANAVAWNNATSLVQEAFYQTSGSNLLLRAELSGCQTAETFSLDKKCSALDEEVQMSCLFFTTEPAPFSPSPAPKT